LTDTVSGPLRRADVFLSAPAASDLPVCAFRLDYDARTVALLPDDGTAAQRLEDLGSNPLTHPACRVVVVNFVRYGPVTQNEIVVEFADTAEGERNVEVMLTGSADPSPRISAATFRVEPPYAPEVEAVTREPESDSMKVSIRVSDRNGAGSISSVSLFMTKESRELAGSCLITLLPRARAIALTNDDATDRIYASYPPLSPSAQISNAQCAIPLASIIQNTDENGLSFTFRLSLAAALARWKIEVNDESSLTGTLDIQ
jgi:hypothetical protein